MKQDNPFCLFCELICAERSWLRTARSFRSQRNRLDSRHIGTRNFTTEALSGHLLERGEFDELGCKSQSLPDPYISISVFPNPGESDGPFGTSPRVRIFFGRVQVINPFGGPFWSFGIHRQCGEALCQGCFIEILFVASRRVHKVNQTGQAPGVLRRTALNSFLFSLHRAASAIGLFNGILRKGIKAKQVRPATFNFQTTQRNELNWKQTWDIDPASTSSVSMSKVASWSDAQLGASFSALSPTCGHNTVPRTCL